MTINVVVTASLECFHKSALRTVTSSDDGKIHIFRIGVDDLRDFKSPHFAHVGGANDGGGGVVLKSSEGEGGLGSGGNVKAFALQGVAQTFSEKNVAVDQQNACRLAGHHARASGRAA